SAAASYGKTARLSRTAPDTASISSASSSSVKRRALIRAHRSYFRRLCLGFLLEPLPRCPDGREDQECSQYEERQADRTLQEHHVVSTRDQQRSPQVFFHHGSKHQAKEQWSGLEAKSA